MACSRVLLEKPTLPQTVKKLHAFLEPNIHYRFDNVPAFCLYPVHASSYLLILFYHQRLGLPSVRFLSGGPFKISRELLSTIRVIWPGYPIIFDLLTPLIFPEKWTHICQQMYLQMHHIMLNKVTTIHRNAVLNRRTVLLLYITKVIHYIRENVKKICFVTQYYLAADLCIPRKKGLLYCCWYCW